MTRALAVALALVVAVALWLWGSKNTVEGERDAAVTAQGAAEAALSAEKEARRLEQASAKSINQIGVTHEEDRSAAEGVPAAVVADLRSGNRRLREQWAACDAGRVSDAAAAATERHAAAVSREADFGNLVRIGRDADDQLRACIAVVEADRAR